MKEGFISTLQSYSTKDGPGIRTTVFCIGCNLRCAWCANPELMLPGEKYMYFKQRCIRCGSCIKHCHGEISMAENGCVINRANIDMDTLRQCEDVCPKSAYEKVGTRITSAALAQKLLRDKEFYTVSGGGVTFSGGEAGLQADFVYETAKTPSQGRCSCNFRYRRTDQMGHFIPFVRRNRSCPIRHQIHRRTDSQKMYRCQQPADP